MVTELERVRPALSTGIRERGAGECTALFKKRGRIVILSDFLDDTMALFDALARTRYVRGVWRFCCCRLWIRMS